MSKHHAPHTSSSDLGSLRAAGSGRSLLAAALIAGAAALVAGAPREARAESRLTTTVYTGSAGGFLVSSTLVAGDKDAVLIDAQFTLPDAHRLIATILESKKNLTTIYVTHSHPDHYYGLAALKAAFPKARLVAQPAAVAEIQKTWKAKLAQWRPMYGALVPAQPVLPTALTGSTITLEGQRLEIRAAQGDSADNTYIWIPSLKTVIAGDSVYNGVHVWTRDTTPAQRKAWIQTLDAISALNPTTVIAGHKDPKAKDDASSVAATRGYLEAFDQIVATARTAEEIQTKMKARYAGYQLDIILQLAAEAAAPAASK